jgi:hypothetical protein
LAKTEAFLALRNGGFALSVADSALSDGVFAPLDGVVALSYNMEVRLDGVPVAGA